MVDDLAVDSRLRHARVSPAGRSVLARTELDEEKLGRLVRGFPPPERRAFWIGVLLRDGAITVAQALTARTAPPLAPKAEKPTPPRSLGVMVSRCRRCGVEFTQPRRQGRPRSLCDSCRNGGR